MSVEMIKIDQLVNLIDAANARAGLALDVVKTSLGEPGASIGALDEFVKALADVAAGSTALLSYIWHEGGR
jgi:hypothetical protein